MTTQPPQTEEIDLTFLDTVPKAIRVRELPHRRLFEERDLDGVCLLPVRGRQRRWARLARARRRLLRLGLL